MKKSHQGNEHNRVSFALVFPDQDSARPETPSVVRSRLVAPDKAIQKPNVILIEATAGLFLDVAANEAGHEVFGKGRRLQRSECGAPQRAKLVEAERPYAGDLGLQRLCVIGSHR
jgi:hypothetical protein